MDLQIMNLPSMNLLLPVPSEISLSDEPSEKLDEDLRQAILTYIDSNYWLAEDIPNKAEICNRFDLTLKELEPYYEAVIEPLGNRGIKLPSFHPPVKIRKGLDKEFEPDPLFVLATSIITDTIDKRSTAAKLKGLSLTSKQWQALLKIPGHKEYFEKRLNLAFNDTHQTSLLSLSKNVEAGDLQSIKYFHEFTGKYRPQTETVINLSIIIGRLMEILSKRLSPEDLNQIADEFDSVLNIKELENPNNDGV